MTEVNRYKAVQIVSVKNGVKAEYTPLVTELVMAEDYDRLKAELDALCSKVEGLDPLIQFLEAATDDSELEALRKDAERYRWLRDANRMDGDDDGFGQEGAIGSIFVCVRPGEAHSVFGERLDEALDAAMTKDKPRD